MTEGGRSLDDRAWLWAGLLSCCLSAGITLAALIAGVNWVLSLMGGM